MGYVLNSPAFSKVNQSELSFISDFNYMARTVPGVLALTLSSESEVFELVSPKLRAKL